MRSFEGTFASILRSRLVAARAGAVVLLSAVAIPLFGQGCAEGRDGDRCNPALSHDECGGDTLVCSGPGTSHPLPGGCVENYCCPKRPLTSSSPECNGSDLVCVVPDAGADEGGVADATPDTAAPDTGAGVAR
jgi:hypothetical protein